MSVNTSDEYLDELLQAIEPIIYPDGPETLVETEAAEETMPITEPEPAMEPESVMEPEPVVEPEMVMESMPIGMPDVNDSVVEVEESTPELDLSEFLVADIDDTPQESEMSQISSDEYMEIDDDSSAIGDLLASLASEQDEADDLGMSEEDVESILSAMGSQQVEETDSVSYDQDVKELLKQFTEDEDLSDIQDMLDKNDNGEALDDSMLDLPDVEVFQLEEDVEEELEDDSVTSKRNILSKVVGGLANLFKKKKEKNAKEQLTDDEPVEAVMEPFDSVESEAALDMADMDEESLLDMMSSQDVEELVLDEDMSDIELLLSGGTLNGAGSDAVSNSEEADISMSDSEDNKKVRKKNKKEKKETIFSKILNMLTEEVEDSEGMKTRVPEAGNTGITDENRNILEELSKEDKKKAKKEAKENKKKDKKNGGKKSSKKGEDEEKAGSKNKKAKNPKKTKKEKKKREKKEKPRKVEVISKPEKRLPKKRVLSVFVLCFSILAGVLILQNVVSKTSNLKEAEYAFDAADYETCFANLSGVERNEEEEALYQKSFIIMMVQRKVDSYYNFMQMNKEVEALNSLLEGVVVYREQEASAAEWGVQGQIMAIYQTICEKLQGYGLSEEDVNEILNYESKVTYTKRLDSIVNGTPFILEDMLEGFDVSEPQPLQDILPGEEDFLPEDTTEVTSGQAVQDGDSAVSEETVEDTYEEQHGQTVVVGSNPVDISEGSQDDFGGQNVGNGGTDVSIEVNDGNVVVGDM